MGGLGYYKLVFFTKEAKINARIKRLNQAGIPIIFVVTGNNSVGKTTLSKELIKRLYFYQSVNLGLASKLIRFLKPNAKHSSLENFKDSSSKKFFKRFIDFVVNSYNETGVNLIIEGVQVDTGYFFDNNTILGGVILDVSKGNVIQRGTYPNTHFKRKIKTEDISHFTYKPNGKFAVVDNNGSLKSTYGATLEHLSQLLNNKLNSI